MSVVPSLFAIFTALKSVLHGGSSMVHERSFRLLFSFCFIFAMVHANYLLDWADEHHERASECWIECDRMRLECFILCCAGSGGGGGVVSTMPNSIIKIPRWNGRHSALISWTKMTRTHHRNCLRAHARRTIPQHNNCEILIWFSLFCF